MQEETYPHGVSFWQGCGYMSFMRESERRVRGVVTAIRHDVMGKHKFEMNIQERQCHTAKFVMQRGEVWLWNSPPAPNTAPRTTTSRR